MTSAQDVKVITKVSLNVPELGEITGICFDGKTTQYMGIPYATVPGRFRRPQPAAVPWPDQKWDGTKVGPFPSQPPRDFYPIPNPSRPWLSDAPTTSSTDCLSMNISVPSPPSPIPTPQKYPVMLFLHGGAFVYAAGGAAIYDGRILSEISAKLDMPTIIISINFRLGLFGFLASEEIREYNAEHGEDGVGNYGIWDQVDALRWVQRFIGGFGGDKERVTLFGQSAGGVSANIHLLRNEPLFSRAIIQSGLLPLCGVLTPSQYQSIYNKTLTHLAIPSSLSPRERLLRLINTPEEALTAAMVPVLVTPVITLSPCDDGVLIGGPMPTYSQYSAFAVPPWCGAAMLGDVRHECVIWNKAFRALPPTALVAKIRRVLDPSRPHRRYSNAVYPPTAAQTIIALYGLREDMTQNDLFWATERMTTDALYSLVNFKALRAQPRMLGYHFDVPSPFENEWGGLAHHSLDNVYVWGLLKERLPGKHQRVSELMSKCWVEFANGKEPWGSFGEGGRVMVFGGEVVEAYSQLRTPEEDRDRGYERWEAIEKAGLVDAFYDLAVELCMRQEEICDEGVVSEALTVEGMEKYGIVPVGVERAWS
ncbi:alpha/beta-hydrolase [Mytilinidion resinicola]|uniref:Carboxylic ester hydrolase n=1 Tax=Mytilinidion resinicola TaxID=574789 RepID=A0A6A6YNK5_9PEZI|nr:alpha/beta-hydrolase [Mytilinidion resinicola]KAF2809447.1 alpha/beta-hydrolase [Mytilinidion resinicola]